MLPYMIRLNPLGTCIFIIICLVIYFIYFSSFTINKPKLFQTISDQDSLFPDNINLKELLIASIKAAENGGHEVVKVRNSNDLNQRLKGKTKEGVDDVLTEGDLKSHWTMVQGLSTSFQGLKIISEEYNNNQIDNLEFEPIYISKKYLYDEEYSQLPNDIDLPIGELTVWIDPLDATKEYSENLTQYVTTMVCVARNGDPIIGVIHKPFTSETFWGWVNQGTSANININSQKQAKDLKDYKFIVSRSHAGDVEQTVKSAFGPNTQVISAAGSGYKTIQLINGHVDAYVHETIIKKWDICAPNAILNSIIGGKMTTLNGDLIKYNDIIIGHDVEINNGILATVNKNHNEILKILKPKSS